MGEALARALDSGLRRNDGGWAFRHHQSSSCRDLIPASMPPGLRLAETLAEWTPWSSHGVTRMGFPPPAVPSCRDLIPASMPLASRLAEALAGWTPWSSHGVTDVGGRRGLMGEAFARALDSGLRRNDGGA